MHVQRTFMSRFWRGSGDMPPGVYLLAGLEYWERFSFYALMSLLPVYLKREIGYAPADADAIVGNYKGLIYLTPVIGALISDLSWGARKCLIVGGCFMALGHFAMGIHGQLLVGLALMVLGNGLFKPSCTTMVKTLFPEDEEATDAE